MSVTVLDQQYSSTSRVDTSTSEHTTQGRGTLAVSGGHACDYVPPDYPQIVLNH